MNIPQSSMHKIQPHFSKWLKWQIFPYCGQQCAALISTCGIFVSILPFSDHVNTPRTSDVNMRQWTLFPIMACRLFSAKHYLYQCWHIIDWTHGSRIQWKFDRNTLTSTQKKWFKDGCKIAASCSKKFSGSKRRFFARPLTQKFWSRTS